MAGILAGPTWGQGDSSDEGSDDDLLFEASESEDDVEEISDEEDDAAVRGTLRFDGKFSTIPSPLQTLQFEARDKTVWSNNIPTTGRRSFVNKWTSRDKVQGIRDQIPRVKAASSKQDLLRLQITDDMIDGIVNWTNIYAKKTLANESATEEIADQIPEIGGEEEVGIEPSLQEGGMRQGGLELATQEDVNFLTDTGALVDPDDDEDFPLIEWPETDRTEILAFMGLLILAGAERIRKTPTHLMWTSDPKFRKPPFVATMARNRFQSLLRFVRLDDKETRPQRRLNDKLAAIREFTDAFQKNLFEIYEPGPHLVVDEMLVKFRGRCPFRVYMKSKPGRYGIKIWALVDAKSRFVCQFQVYLGKQGGVVEKNQGQRVLMDLLRNFFGSWRGVTADNFFGSKAAAEELMKNQLTSLFTMRAIRREIPKEILAIKDVHQSKFMWHDNTMLVAYKAKPSKIVLLMSTQHQTPYIHTLTPHKPEVIFDYNATKGGVDTVDQLVAEFTCRRRSNRWPMTVLMQCIDIAAVNAWVMWQSKNPSWMKGKRFRRLNFLRMLSEELVAPAIDRRGWNGLKLHIQECTIIMGATPPAPPQIQPTSENDQQQSAQDDAYEPPSKVSKKAYCHVCKCKKTGRTRQKCDGCKNYACQKCAQRICKTCFGVTPNSD